jgi:hypothetical protein
MRHIFSDYDSSDTLSRHDVEQFSSATCVIQGMARKPQTINLKDGRTMVVAPKLQPFNRDKSRRQKLLRYARDYKNLRVRDLVNTI